MKNIEIQDYLNYSQTCTRLTVILPTMRISFPLSAVDTYAKIMNHLKVIIHSFTLGLPVLQARNQFLAFSWVTSIITKTFS